MPKTPGRTKANATKQLCIRFLAISVGCLLTAAAISKALSPVEVVKAKLTLGILPKLSVLVIPLELAFAFVLLFIRHNRAILVATFALFVAFAAYAFIRAASGADSCSCFGTIEVNPWITFGVDSTIAIATLSAAFWHSDYGVTASKMPVNHLPWAATYVFFALFTTILAVVNLPQEAANGTQVGNGKIAILEPESWIGRPLPLSSSLTPFRDLNTGTWTLLLYHHECPKCQEAVPQYMRLVSNSVDAPKILLVEVPPASQVPDSVAPALYATLPNDREWFVQAPVEITIINGIVHSVSKELPSVGGDDGETIQPSRE